MPCRSTDRLASRDATGLGSFHAEAVDDPAQRWISDIAQRRDIASFKALFALFAPRVLQYLISRGYPQTAAEQLTEDTFVAIWDSAARFDPTRQTVAAWIFAVSREQWAGRAKRRASRGLGLARRGGKSLASDGETHFRPTSVKPVSG